MLKDFRQKGKASFLVGGQWGSEGKGAAAAWVAKTLADDGKFFDIVTTNAGAQAGHTSVHKNNKRVVYHLPTAPLITADELPVTSLVYLNSGSVIDPDVFEEEIKEFKGTLFIHPMAAIITEGCKEAERDEKSAQTKIASTRKGVGEAISRKVLRKGIVARDFAPLKHLVRRIDLNAHMNAGKSVLVEVPQGVSLSLNHGSFYPYCTSRDCIPSSAMADAGIHPSFYGQSMVVFRTFPIRVGHISENGELKGESGPCFPDQEEITWDMLGVQAEITTVTKRVRRVFSFSAQQIIQTMAICRPDIVYITFCDYVKNKSYMDKFQNAITYGAKAAGKFPNLIFQDGPTTEDVWPGFSMK